ncbi:Thiol-disulfide isomerase or thioredoxin [Chryseobacterium oleae]|uniref:Thiol-disulfide isomerase or thioredoxin n=1 Tax=Chryseobacterium oleae TaxID=491207 RepID=A0A1I5ATA4_CHROL|nr:TlpA disulfide reductase family protein [Chryseobacterium oleae]SFN65673.1 Thiol-disulfide isomerase or thioredoxin [Chryseobacterium oleae]
MKSTNFKSKFIALCMLLMGNSVLFSQQTIMEAFGIPLESIKKDQKGNILTNAQFSDSLYTAKYIFDPILEGTKMTEAKLKLIGPELIAKKVPEAIKQLIKTLDFKPKPAIDFTVTDMKGKKYQLSKLKNKTVVLNFWYTNCGPCIKEIPELNELVKANPDVIFIAFAEDKSNITKKFLTKHPFTYAIVPDASKISRQYGIAAFPTHYVVKNGMFTHKFISDGSTKKIQDAINEK